MKKKTILITGASGLIGSSFVNGVSKKTFGATSLNNINSNIGILITPLHERMEIADKDSLNNYIERYKPDIFINFAAHRNANTAEEQRGDKNGSAWKTNVNGTENIVEITKRKGIFLIHVSTDMVFSGKEEDKGPYLENYEDEPSLKDLSWYGWTKRLAEKEILSHQKDSVIIRIANVTKPIYDPKLDYIGKILWSYDHKNLYPVFSDQRITITYIPEIIEAIVKIIQLETRGIYHVASRDLCTPFELANYLIMKSRNKINVVQKSSVDDYLTNHPNRYPKYGGLGSFYTQERLGINFLSWKEVVNKFIEYEKDNLSVI